MIPDGQPAGRSSSSRQIQQRDEKGKFISSRNPRVSGRHSIDETAADSTNPQKLSEQKQETSSNAKQMQEQDSDQKQKQMDRQILQSQTK